MYRPGSHGDFGQQGTFGLVTVDYEAVHSVRVSAPASPETGRSADGEAVVDTGFTQGIGPERRCSRLSSQWLVSLVSNSTPGVRRTAPGEKLWACL